ncbi:MAG: DUF87 domain-containing protein [Desulfurococcales archaeon]|nr:DUF87 domain-containing protein [Desulfurococcales archaeon]
MNNETPITGFTTSIREYTRVEGIILRPAEAIVKYGTIVEIEDNSQRKRYLAMIVNVEEETPHPALDVERLRKLYQSLSETSLQDANRVLLELLSPTHQLIKWSSIMKVELRVLGEITRHHDLERLSPYERPPRPFSSIIEPDPIRLEKIIHHSLGKDYELKGIYIGKLSLADQVRIYINPEKLNTHLSILAQTGGGKTETVKRLVFEISQRRNLMHKPKGGIVVFDIAGEYTGYPYDDRNTVFLLDAVLDPSSYNSLVEDPSIPEKVTIIVPYETTRGHWEETRKDIWNNMRDLACKLSSRLDEDVDLLVVFPYERLYERISPYSCHTYNASGNKAKINYNNFASIVESSRFLVLGMPLPGFMNMDAMIELSGTKSEYFELIINEIAGILDLYHGEDIYGVGLLYSIFRNWDNLEKVSNVKETVQRILKIFLITCELNVPDPIKLRELLSNKEITNKYGLPSKDIMINLLLDRRNKDLYYSLFRYIAWKAYKWKVADPFMDNETSAICKVLNDDRYSDRLKQMLSDLLFYVSSKTIKIDKNTRYGIVRRLKKLSTMTSDMIDTIVFDILMNRLMTGFSIVHLAPPSVGDVDTFLGLTIRRLFYRHARNYDPDRLTVLVVEEAHNLAPAGISKSSKDALLRVAREGRKWGLSMWLVTQRPSFVDSSILSQTATSILLRTTNPEDLASIKRGVESAAAEIIDRLPELEPSRGEALLTGLAAPERRIPLLIMVERLRPVRRQQ